MTYDYFKTIKNNIRSKYKNRAKFTIKEIFNVFWDEFLDYAKNQNLTIRNIVKKEVDKIIACGTAALGYSQFNCPSCGDFNIVFHTCKSRFCLSCGMKYVKDRINYFKTIMFDCKHRHMVFTIPKQLRYVFREDRYRINLLFKAVKLTLSDFFNEKSLTPGFISVLHTFGRDIKFNTHIHVLLTEGGVNTSGKFTSTPFIPFDFLRKRYQFHLLNLLSNVISPKLKNELFIQYPKGFYVRAKKKKFSDNIKEATYILRYTGKPPIASSRIIDVDYDSKEITFKYNSHEDNKEIIEKIHIFDFIKRLIVHIHEFNFKTIRYYGIYASANKTHSSIKSNTTITPYSWRQSIINDFNYDPLICEKCNTQMILEYSYFPT